MTPQQVNYLINVADSVRDKCIISLFADSRMRLSELANIHVDDIDWQNYTITILGKGNKQRKAVFTQRSARLLKEWLSTYKGNGMVWDIDYHGIQCVLKRLEK